MSSVSSSSTTTTTTTTACVCGSVDHHIVYYQISRKALDEDLGDYQYGYCPHNVTGVNVADLIKQAVADSGNIWLHMYKVLSVGGRIGITTNTSQLSSYSVIRFGWSLARGVSITDIVGQQQQQLPIVGLEIKPYSINLWIKLVGVQDIQLKPLFKTYYINTEPFRRNINLLEMSTIGHLMDYITITSKYNFRVYLTEKVDSLTEGLDRRELRYDMPISRAWLYGQFADSLIVINGCDSNPNNSDALITANNNDMDLINANITKLSISLSETIKECLPNQTKAITDTLVATVGSGDCRHKYLTDLYVDDDSETDTQCCDQSSVNTQLNDNISDNNSSSGGDKTNVNDLIPSLSTQDMNISDMNDIDDDDCYLNKLQSVLNRKKIKIKKLMKMKAEMNQLNETIKKLTEDINEKLNL